MEKNKLPKDFVKKALAEKAAPKTKLKKEKLGAKAKKIQKAISNKPSLAYSEGSY